MKEKKIGVIVIKIIGMQNREHYKMVVATLKEAVNEVN